MVASCFSNKPMNVLHCRKFHHPHLVQLFGVCSEKPIYIITEFMTQGGILFLLTLLELAKISVFFCRLVTSLLLIISLFQISNDPTRYYVKRSIQT